WTYAEACATLPDGRLPAWRFRAPDRDVAWTDRVRGPQRCNVARTTGDFVLARHPDGAGYQLAVVVDDAAMGVTEVLRGDDLCNSTARQILLQDALDLPRPDYAHVPLVVGPDGRRLAKRHGDTRLAAVRAAGTRPERVVGWLAASCGWADPGACLSPRDLLECYDPDTLPRDPVVVGPEVLAELGLAPPTA
ncbi:MAG: glutamate--tRNA ligase family protein, partial [Planctomycetota bacterium]